MSNYIRRTEVCQLGILALLTSLLSQTFPGQGGYAWSPLRPETQPITCQHDRHQVSLCKPHQLPPSLIATNCPSPRADIRAMIELQRLSPQDTIHIQPASGSGRTSETDENREVIVIPPSHAENRTDCHGTQEPSDALLETTITTPISESQSTPDSSPSSSHEADSQDENHDTHDDARIHFRSWSRLVFSALDVLRPSPAQLGLLVAILFGAASWVYAKKSYNLSLYQTCREYKVCFKHVSNPSDEYH